MATVKLTTPLAPDVLAQLRAGDIVLLSGVVYTGRDSAHRRIAEALDRGESPPFDLKGAVIYYVGPTPPPPGRPIGAAGPTTAGRMDAYAPRLHALGLAASIGKGLRSQAVKDALREHTAVYFGATGGAGALLSKSVVSAEVIAYEDLGTEAVRKLVVRDMPLLVIGDTKGNELYTTPELEAALHG